MKALYFIFLALITSTLSNAQVPKSGTYIYTIVFAEWNNLEGPNCKVIIEDNKVVIIHDGGNLSGKKGDIIEEGILMKHKSGVWVIGQKDSDKDAEEIGGCTGGPTIINFEMKTITLC